MPSQMTLTSTTTSQHPLLADIHAQHLPVILTRGDSRRLYAGGQEEYLHSLHPVNLENSDIFTKLYK